MHGPMYTKFIRFYSPYLKKVLGKLLPSANIHNFRLSLVRQSSSCESEKSVECTYCFLSGRLQCEDYYYTVYP